jgi:glycosyltransferase involved in cell wall biosynthesis
MIYMKILIVSQYYYPEQFLINEIAEELAKQGNEVTVLTGLPNYPSGKISSDYKWPKKRHEIINGVEVIRCFEIPRGKPKLSRLIINYISYMISASLRSLFLEDYDVVFSYQLTPITQVLPAAIYKKIKRKKLLVYCLDLFPYSFDHWTKPGSLIHKVVRKSSEILYDSADIIAVSSSTFINYMNNVNKIPSDRIVYLPQHASEDMLTMDLSREKNEICNFMFAGNIGSGQNIEVIVEAANILKDKYDFRIHLVGSGNNVENLKKVIKNKDLDDYFIFRGSFKMSEMPRIYKDADALLITLRSGQLTMPGKLQTYMTTGKPIFGSIDGAAYEVIKESKSGGCVSAGDAEEFALLMADFIDNTYKYEKCGENARKYFVENFKKNIFIDKLLGLLTDLSD